jgi:hypothetical protein
MNPLGSSKISSPSSLKGELSVQASATETTSLLHEKKKKTSSPFALDVEALLSDEENIEEIKEKQRNRWWRSSTYSILTLLAFFLLIYWWTSSLSSSTSPSSLILNLRDQERVYFKTYSGNYLRVDSNGTVSVTDSTFPWITGSTFRIEMKPSKSSSHLCWTLRSRGTGSFVGLDQNSQKIVGNVNERDALCFQASRISTNSTYVNLKAMTLNRWLSLTHLQKNRGPTLTLVDSIPSQLSFSSHDTRHLFEIEPIPLLQGVNLGGTVCSPLLLPPLPS